jgi:hypothetical protein
MMFDSDQNDDPEALQTVKLISQARTPGTTASAKTEFRLQPGP